MSTTTDEELASFPEPTWDELSIFEQISLMPPATQNVMVDELVANGLDITSPDVMLRPKQLSIVRDFDSWVSAYCGGRGTGKTKVGSEWVNERAERFPGSQGALLGRTVADVRDVMVKGESGILASAREDFMPEYRPSLRLIEWPNGSIAQTYSADAPDQLRGPQQHWLWADEAAAYSPKPDSSGATAWDNALLSTRLGERPQLLVTTTPKRVPLVRWLYHQALSDPRVTLTEGSTFENRSNLSPDYIAAIHGKYAGTHLE